MSARIALRFGLILLVILIASPKSIASSERFELTISNDSLLNKNNALIAIDLPSEYQGKFFQIYQDNKPRPLLYRPKEHRLYVQTDIQHLNNNIFQLHVLSKPVATPPLQQFSTVPGTEYLFINYRKAILISCQDNNKIHIETKDGETLDNIELNKGQMHLVHAVHPQMLKVSSDYPVFVYMSSIQTPEETQNFQEGDSDTTTLFGSDLYFYTDRHVWISSYQDSKISIKDQQGFAVWEDLLPKNTGFKIPDLRPGSYHLYSDHAVTLQFGYLDDENFSFLYGRENQINGFSYGELLVYALHPNTKIDLVFYNPKKQQKTISLKSSGDFDIVSMIDAFAPLQPEYCFFTMSFSKPVLVNTFSSGTNFGGDYVPGANNLFVDQTFNYITPRVLKEFSKEQKNMIELLALYPQTSISISNTIQQDIMLQQDTSFNYQTDESLALIKIDGDRPFLLSQLHNYTDKGLFMWVPPIHDKTLHATIGPLVLDSISENGKTAISWKNLWDPLRFKEFFSHLTHKQYLPFTIFFFSILAGMIVLLFILIQRKKQVLDVKENMVYQENDLLQLMHEMEKNEQKAKPSIETALPDTPGSVLDSSSQETENEKLLPEDSPSYPYPTLTTSLDDWIDRLKEKTVNKSVKNNETPQTSNEEENQITDQTENERKATHDDIELPFLDVDHTKTSEELTLRKSDQSKLLAFSHKAVVLDPGSANRLYHENLLQQFSQAWMAKSSAKRLHPDIVKNIHQIELSAQDLSRAELFQERLETIEEAGKALALCKKKHINVFLTSYRLPNFIGRIQIIHISEILKDL